MSKLEESAKPIAVEVGGGRLWVELEDGRLIGVPLEWYMPLANATVEQINRYELLDGGIHWPDLDEHLSIAGMLAGVRPHYPWSSEEWKARSEAVRVVTERYGPDATILMPIDMRDPLDAKVTAREIADDYGLSTDAVYQAIRRKRLPAQRSGATWLIRLRDAEAFWGTRRQSASTATQRIAVREAQPQSRQDVREYLERRNEITNMYFSARTLKVIEATITMDRLYITLSKKPGISLKKGDTVSVLDMEDLAWKGIFSVTGEDQTGHKAVEKQNADPVWKGYVRYTQDENRVEAPQNMVAAPI